MFVFVPLYVFSIVLLYVLVYVFVFVLGSRPSIASLRSHLVVTVVHVHDHFGSCSDGDDGLDIGGDDDNGGHVYIYTGAFR